MPQIQVLERNAPQGDSSYDNYMDRAQKERELVANAKFKAGQLKTWAEENKIRAKNAQTDADKTKYTTTAGYSNLIATRFEDGLKRFQGDPDNLQKYLMSTLQGVPGARDVVMDPEFLKFAGPTAGEQKDIAQAGKYEAEAGEARAGGEKKSQLAALYGRIGGGGGGGGTVGPPGAQAGVQGAGVNTQQAPGNDARAGADQWDVTKVSGAGGDPELVNISARSRLAAAETTAREGAKHKIMMKPIQGQLTMAKRIFADAFKEIGGPGDTGLSAKLKGWAGEIGGEWGRMPANQAFSKIMGALGLSVASLLNRGRPSDRDFEAAAAMLFSTKYPMATNMYLMEYIDSIMSTGDTAQSRLLNQQLFGNWMQRDATSYDDKADGGYGMRDDFKTRIEKLVQEDREFIQNMMEEDGMTREAANAMLFKIREKSGLRKGL